MSGSLWEASRSVWEKPLTNLSQASHKHLTNLSQASHKALTRKDVSYLNESFLRIRFQQDVYFNKMSGGFVQNNIPIRIPVLGHASRKPL